MTGFCANCGSQLAEIKKFCKYCGAKIEIEQETAQTNQGPPDYWPPAPAAPQPPPAPQQQPAYAAPAPVYAYAYSDKQKVLWEAPQALNNLGQPWEVGVEGDSIVARWKWMDATFFSPHEINEQTKAFTYTVTLNNNGKYTETDRSDNKSAGVKAGGGKVGFGSSSSTFIGNSSQKSIQFGVGQNNRTGETGLIGFKFDTAAVKTPIRDYLTACGWKKAGLFG